MDNFFLVNTGNKKSNTSLICDFKNEVISKIDQTFHCLFKQETSAAKITAEEVNITTHHVYNNKAVGP